MKHKKSTWRKNSTLSSEQVTNKTLSMWWKICVLRKKKDSLRLFSSEEFLTTQQMQSFFSRLASKLRHAVEVGNSDIKAAQEEQEYHENRQAMLDQVQLQHPIAYESLNLCKLNKKGRMKALSLAMLKTIATFLACLQTDFTQDAKRTFPR